MRTFETVAGCVVAGFDVNDSSIGPTPEHWGNQLHPGSTMREELWLLLCGSLLGDVFGWATQQNGAIIHDVSPARTFESSQLGSGSSVELAWHTEEAFHPYKGDYLTLLSLRNRDLVPTRFASIAGVELESDVVSVLLQPRFHIRPDDSHLQPLPTTGRLTNPNQAMLRSAREDMDEMNRSPAPVAVLFGDPAAPYIAIDPHYMEVPPDDLEARLALSALAAAIETRLQDVVLRAGDLMILDNFRAVHGRAPFRARYDGTDRWLKRINITRDLRKSRARRSSCGSRIIY